MLTKKRLIEDYESTKRKAYRAFGEADDPRALKYIDLCARVAYEFNFIYADEELEQLVANIGERVCLDKKAFQPVNSKVVFYDCFGFDNRGLTQQYLRGIMAMGCELLYILEGTAEKADNIIEELRAYKKAEIVVLKGADYISKIKKAYSIISNYRPSKAFLHLAPWSVVACAVWPLFPQIERFFINLTDHAFWLGKKTADYFIEFRSYGCNVSLEKRLISEDKILMLPYYPIQLDGEFNGFPIDFQGKVLGFSGAAYYKVYGKNGLYLELIKEVLLANKNFVLLFAGWGDSKPLLNFIKQNMLEHQIILIGNRSDINEVLKRIDIYVNTYPFGGGLITQLAAVNNKPIVTYSSKDLAFNFIEQFLQIRDLRARTLVDRKEFVNEMNQLIRDPAYRVKVASYYNDVIPSKEDFNKNLFRMVNDQTKKNITVINPISIDYDAIFDLFLESENSFQNRYDKIMLYQLRYEYLAKRPIKALRVILKKLFF